MPGMMADAREDHTTAGMIVAGTTERAVVGEAVVALIALEPGGRLPATRVRPAEAVLRSRLRADGASCA